MDYTIPCKVSFKIAKSTIRNLEYKFDNWRKMADWIWNSRWQSMVDLWRRKIASEREGVEQGPCDLQEVLRILYLAR